jgi:hypothetical protein
LKLFNGPAYVPARDDERLLTQLERVLACLKLVNVPMSLREIQLWIEMRFGVTDPQASISAQIRHLRKDRFGGHTIERTHAGDGLFVYKLVAPKAQAAA